MFRPIKLILFKNTNRLQLFKNYKVCSNISPIMFYIRNEPEKKIVEITFSFPTSSIFDREFNLNRSVDEPIGKTFEKLSSNLIKHLELKQKKKTKKFKSEGNLALQASEEEEDIKVTIQLFDNFDKEVSNQTLNQHAWVEGYKVRINDNFYNVIVDLPRLKKLALPKLLIAGMPVTISTDKEDKIVDKCKFQWYISSKVLDRSKWELLSEGVNKRVIHLDDKCDKKYLKLVCIPSDGKRYGIPIETVSNKPIEKLFEIKDLPMSDRHKLTKQELDGNKYVKKDFAITEPGKKRNDFGSDFYQNILYFLSSGLSSCIFIQH